jgi:phytoene dehydrogenase-like protein
VSSIPVNNTLPLFQNGAAHSLEKKYQRKILPTDQLNGAFSLGIAFRKHREFDCIHHQIHLPRPIPGLHSNSIFLSLSHPEDTTRCAPGECVASVSSHAGIHPDQPLDKAAITGAILALLEEKDFLRRDHILLQHASTPGGWEKWTLRQGGFVGGYPQYMKIRPWNMIDARMDGKGAYLCGDSTYPGQGIPGACLSGIIAFEKLQQDFL